MVPIYFVHTHPNTPLDTYGIKAYPLTFHDDERILTVPKLGEPAPTQPDVVSIEDANLWLSKLDWINHFVMAICRWDYHNRHPNMIRMSVWVLPESLGITDFEEPEWYKPSPVYDQLIKKSDAERRSAANKLAATWVNNYISKEKLDRDFLTNVDWFLLTKSVPCHVRCWRTGLPVSVEPGEMCPECGKLCPMLTVWERIML